MTGIGNPLHLTMEMLKVATGIEVQAVPLSGRRAAQHGPDRRRDPARRRAVRDRQAARRWAGS